MPEAFLPIGCRKKPIRLDFDEVLRKGVPDEFVLFAPVLSALTLKASSGQRWLVVRPWKPCVASDSVEMQEDSWHDDRMDHDLSALLCRPA
jgi:hypothetical protein